MTVFAFWFDSNKEQHYPFLSRVMLTRELEEDDDDDGEELPGDEEKHELFCSLKANSLKTRK